MNGLDLFTGIGGITIAIKDWVRPVAYCEIDKYCQSVILQRMSEGNLPKAPIWDDVRTLPIEELPRIDIITAGFPCQDISVAGTGKGLEGERSGLFFEIMRLVREIKPSFVFLENVPAIRTRGLDQVLSEFTKERYDCRWTMLSAASVGARHRRERWFLLGYAKHNGSLATKKQRSFGQAICNDKKGKNKASQSEGTDTSRVLANTKCKKSPRLPSREEKKISTTRICGKYITIDQWQNAVANVCRTTDGLPNRLDRIKALGNSVVPLQVRTAFKRLMGIKTP